MSEDYKDVIRNSNSIFGMVMSGKTNIRLNNNTQAMMRLKWIRNEADKMVHICPECDRLWEKEFLHGHAIYIKDGVRYGKGKKICPNCD